jgi:hypothetical protein
MDLSPDNVILNDLRPEDFSTYLSLTGWNSEHAGNERWDVFMGHEDADGEPLEIVLPKSTRSVEARFHLASAVNLLSAMGQDDPETIIARIKLFDYDVLRIRDIETGQFNSIPLKLAAHQVNAMKNLVAFSACSEDEARTHFVTYQIKNAKEMLDHYRFGQTFSGSFGYSIESKLIREPSRYFQTQMRFDERINGHEDEDDINPVLLPIERRVMERIVRGLVLTQQYSEQESVDGIVEQYHSGFNANMCEAIVDMSEKKRMPIECNILWSPKIQPSRDIAKVKSVQLNARSYQQLEIAAVKLRNTQPQEIVIKGRVTDLSASDNPLGNPDAKRSVIIKWTYRPSGRPIKIIVSLDKSDYLTAIEAHQNWWTVEITGILQRAGNIWKLARPHGFAVVGK